MTIISLDIGLTIETLYAADIGKLTVWPYYHMRYWVNFDNNIIRHWVNYRDLV